MNGFTPAPKVKENKEFYVVTRLDSSSSKITLEYIGRRFI
jgi:hypothetical protein